MSEILCNDNENDFNIGNINNNISNTELVLTDVMGWYFCQYSKMSKNVIWRTFQFYQNSH